MERFKYLHPDWRTGGFGWTLLQQQLVKAISYFLTISKKPCVQAPNPGMRLTMHKKQKKKQNGRENTLDDVMQSCFMVISHHYKYTSITGQLKGIVFPTVSLSWLIFSPFFLSILEIPVICFLVRVTKKKGFQVYPKAPERKWVFPSVGNTVCLCLHYIPAAIESQGGTIPRMVSQISIQRTKKKGL